MSITRRTAIITGCAALASLSFGCRKNVVVICAGDPDWIDPAAALRVDVHGHVFNATDLQVKEFVNRVATKQLSGGLATLARNFAPLIAQVGWLLAPDAKAEQEALQKISAQLKKCPRGTLRTVMQSVAGQQYRIGVRELKASAGRVRANPPTTETNRAAAWEAAPELEKGLRAVEEFPEDPTQPAVERTAHLSPEEFAERTSLSSAIRFLVSMFQYRYVSVFEHLEIYNGAQRRLDLVLPSLVDYDFWLAGGKSTPTTLPQQVEIMSKVSVLTGGRAHAFVPFCPFREAQHRATPSSTFSSLEFVKKAVATQGAAGIKLYPPMGFAALGNAQLGDIWKAASWLPPLAHTPGFGAALDAALRDLYRWCTANDVPIMAHTNRSNGPLPEFEALAGPAGWATALTEFPGLRISFGHFGSVVARSTGQADAARFVDLMNIGPGAAGRFAYADSSYFSEIMDKPVVLEDALAQLFENDAHAKKVLPQRLMFGSDWKMLLLEQGSEGYVDGFERLSDKLVERLAPVGDFSRLKNAFFGGNAVDFVGLRSGDKARQRIEKFYRDNSVDPRPLWRTKVDRP